MTAKEWTEFGLRILGLLLSWPVAFFIVLVLFRAELRSLLPDLARRVTKLPGGIELEAAKQLQAFQEAAKTVTQEVKDPAVIEGYLARLARKVADSAALATKPRSSEPFSVLWVDDDPINNEFESGLLRNLGAMVTSARSTQEALSVLESGHFDLLISDIHRRENGKDNPEAGYDLLEKVRASGNPIPVIFYSMGQPNEKKMGSAFGFATTPSRLINLVQNVLGRKPVRVEQPKRYDM